MVWRVRERKTFDVLARRGARGRSGPVRVRFVPEDNLSVARVAYSVGRRVGGAVVRNRLRRRLRSVVADLDSDRGLRSGAYLVSADGDASPLSSAGLREHVEDAMRTAWRRVEPTAGRR